MKKGLVLVLSVLVALTFSGVILAQQNPPEKTAPAPVRPDAPDKVAPQFDEKMSAPNAKPMTTKPKEKTMTGTVVSIDEVASTIIVKVKGKERTFVLDPAVKVTIDGADAKLADLQKDAKVTIVYKSENKKKVALAIR
ncbi:MAG TPA: hypothetical protein VMT60_03330 [Candidatus Bathyarchaeia archaeon]|nr:hypothetical protein [Candidatus Bathyarchaeia archaeon]